MPNPNPTEQTEADERTLDQRVAFLEEALEEIVVLLPLVIAGRTLGQSPQLQAIHASGKERHVQEQRHLVDAARARREAEAARVAVNSATRSRANWKAAADR
jgi:hypothetical protein